MSRRDAVLGVGAGLAAAGLATVGAVAVDRLWRDRRQAVALGIEEDFTVEPVTTEVVLADDGVPLYVEVSEPADWDGTGPTVVLNHGFTLDLRCWTYQRRALIAAGHRVVAWDLRGHGRSGEGEQENYHIDQLGMDLRAVLAQVAPTGPVVLAGHSMGGMTIMALADADPGLFREQVLGVALISTSAGGLHRITWGLGSLWGGAVNRLGPRLLQQVSPHQNLIDSVLRGGRELQEFFVARGSFGSPVPLSVVRLTADMIFGTPLSVMSAFTTTLDEHDKREALAVLADREVLVFSGDKDALTSAVHSAEIVEAIPGAEHVLVQDAGHIIMLEHPDLLNRELLALVQRAMRCATVPEPERRTRTKDRRAGRSQTVTNLDKRRRDARARPQRRRDVG